MKKYRIVAVFVMILLMGCGSAQNGKMKESSTMKESEETISIKTYDWNHARIKDMVDMQCFGNGPIVQNENYIFYPKDGYKVARVDKEKKDEKIIYEFTPSKEEGVGVHITLGEDVIFFEYDGNIVSSDYDGENVVKIISKRNMEKRLSKDIDFNYYQIWALHYYKKNLYFMSRFRIYEYDIRTGAITLLDDDTDEVCFCGNSLFISRYSWTALYEVNLSNHKKKRIRGKETNIKEVENTDAVKYYQGLMEVDNEFYYVRRHNGGKRPAVYQYCKGGKDKKIYEFEISPGHDYDEIPVCDSSKIACSYYDNDIEDKSTKTLFVGDFQCLFECNHVFFHVFIRTNKGFYPILAENDIRKVHRHQHKQSAEPICHKNKCRTYYRAQQHHSCFHPCA